MILKAIYMWTVITFCIEGANCKLYDFCEGVDHGSYFEYGCCNGTQLDYGVDFAAHWKECTEYVMTKQPETIEESMVRITNLIFKDLGAGTFTFDLF